MKIINKFLKEKWYNKVSIVIGFMLFIIVIAFTIALIWPFILIGVIIVLCVIAIERFWSFCDK